jgi:hypothetical protein
MRRKIVDSNYLGSEMLSQYLSNSPGNYALLTDYAAMEAYKGDTLKSIYKSMEILGERPDQVVVLKNTLVACGLSGQSRGLQRRLIDHIQTREFNQYCKLLAMADAGDQRLQKQLLDHGAEADRHMKRLLDDAKLIQSSVEEITLTLDGAELDTIRGKRKPTAAFTTKLIKNIMVVAAMMFRDHPRVKRMPNWQEVQNTFIFRYAVCAYLIILRYISTGGAKGKKLENTRNDFVDGNFAAYATFFDGLLTSDEKLKQLYKDTCSVLKMLAS